MKSLTPELIYQSSSKSLLFLFSPSGQTAGLPFLIFTLYSSLRPRVSGSPCAEDACWSASVSRSSFVSAEIVSKHFEPLERFGQIKSVPEECPGEQPCAFHQRCLERGRKYLILIQKDLQHSVEKGCPSSSRLWRDFAVTTKKKGFLTGSPLFLVGSGGRI